MCSATCGAYSAKYGSVSQLRIFLTAAGESFPSRAGGFQLFESLCYISDWVIHGYLLVSSRWLREKGGWPFHYWDCIFKMILFKKGKIIPTLGV